jgi:hypothetical protein
MGPGAGGFDENGFRSKVDGALQKVSREGVAALRWWWWANAKMTISLPALHYDRFTNTTPHSFTRIHTFLSFFLSYFLRSRRF